MSPGAARAVPAAVQIGPAGPANPAAARCDHASYGVRDGAHGSCGQRVWISKEAAVNEQPGDSTVQRGEALTLRQPSPRRRAYRLRRGDQTIGWLKFPPGRRSLALAEDEGTGSLVLTASGGRVESAAGRTPPPQSQPSNMHSQAWR
jgi:hypothetical protein